MSPIDKTTIANSRLGQWSSAVEAELQSLITQAAQIRKEISSAKTTAKRKYFEKKFAKVQPQVMQMVAAMQYLESTATTDANIPETSSVEALSDESAA